MKLFQDTAIFFSIIFQNLLKQLVVFTFPFFPGLVLCFLMLNPVISFVLALVFCLERFFCPPKPNFLSFAFLLLLGLQYNKRR